MKLRVTKTFSASIRKRYQQHAQRDLNSTLRKLVMITGQPIKRSLRLLFILSLLDLCKLNNTIYDEFNVLCFAKKIDYMPVHDAFEEVFGIYLLLSKKSLQTIELIANRNLNAAFVTLICFCST